MPIIIFLIDSVTRSKYDIHGSSLTSLYWRKVNRNEHNEVETIRDRFDSLALYNIATETGYHHGKSWKNGGLREFTDHINAFTKGNHTTEEKEENLEKWVAAGRSYWQWINCLTKLDTNESSESEDDSGADMRQLSITTHSTSDRCGYLILLTQGDIPETT